MPLSASSPTDALTFSTPAATSTSWSLGSAFATAGIVLFFAGINRYAHDLWWAAPVQLVWLAGAAAMLVVRGARAPMPLLRSPLLMWVLFYFLMTTASAIRTPSGPATAEALQTRYASTGLLVVFAALFDDPRARRIGALAVAAAVVFASCMNVAEFLDLVRFVGPDRVPGRAGGLYVNPNTAALAITFGLAVVIPSVPRRWRIPLVVVGAAGVIPTFSRGAAICFVALILLMLSRKQIGLWPVALVCAAIVTFLTTHAEAVNHFLENVLTTQTWARLHLEQGDSGRVILARNAWRLFADAPLVGNGVGATVSAHNQFLALAGDDGVIGLVAFPALAVALVAANRGAMPFALVLMLAGFFSHNLLEDKAVLLAIALAGTRHALPVAHAVQDRATDASQGVEAPAE